MFLSVLQASEKEVYEKKMNDLDVVDCKMTLGQLKKIYGSRVDKSDIYGSIYYIYNMNIYSELSYVSVCISNDKIIDIDYVFNPTEKDPLKLVKSYFNIEKNLIKKYGSSYKISDEWVNKPNVFSLSKYAEEIREGKVNFGRTWQTDTLYIDHVLKKSADNSIASYFSSYIHYINQVCIHYSEP